jgi:rod shape-determining protein MreD
MSFVLYFIVPIGLILIQTAILPLIPFFVPFYDLLCLFVMYLSLFKSIRIAVSAALLIGLAMDSLSGGPFGLYLTSYCWLILYARWIAKFIHVNNQILWPFIFAAAVIMENIFFVIASMVIAPGFKLPSDTVSAVVFQVFLALITAPFMLKLFAFIFEFVKEPRETQSREG